MLRSTVLRIALLGGSATFSLATPPPAAAQGEQSVNELKQENNRLREQVADLDARLAEAQRRIARLEESNRALRRQLADSELPRATPPATEDGAAPPAPADETGAPGPALAADAFAAPDAMHGALVRAYAETFDGKPRGTDREAERYVQDVRRWARQIGLERRKQVEWVVRVVNATPTEGRDIEFVLEVVDPATLTAIGSPFKIAFSGPLAIRMQQRPDQDLWTISGVFAAAPVVNPDRAGPGLFNVPRFVGPFVEFGFSFTPKSAVPFSPAGTAAQPG